MSGAGSPPPVAAKRAALESERERLLAEQADLLRELPRMQPEIAARAATVLADKLAALATEFENLLEEERHGRVN